MLTTGPDNAPSAGNPYCDWLWAHGAPHSPAARVLRPKPGDSPYPGALDVDLASVAANAIQLMRPGGGNPSPITAGSPARGGKVRYPLPLHPECLPAAALNFPIAPADPADIAHLEALSAEEQEQLVIIGIIDDAVNVAHSRFLDTEKKPRVDFAWIQDGRADGKLPFGREIRAAEIANTLQNVSDPLQQVMALGLADMTMPGRNLLARRLSHGTHVADLAAGYGPRDNSGDPNEITHAQAKSRRIITVHMPHAMVVDTSGGFTLPFVSLAVDYILRRASEIKMALNLSRTLPVIINLSDAVSSGPRDGTGVFERRIDTQLEAAKSAGLDAHLVLPAGNRFLDRGHAVLTDSTVDQPLPWRIQPGDPSSDYLEIWYPADQTPVIEIKPPIGAPVTVTASGTPQHLFWNGDKIGRVSFDLPQSGSRRRALIILGPTEIHGSADQRVPAGIWKLKISGVTLGSEQIDAWIQRDDLPYSYGTAGRQSYFDDPKYKRYADDGYPEVDDNDSIVKRAGTVSGIATNNADPAPPVTVVAGIRAKGRRGRAPEPAATSGGGANGRGPDIATVSERSAALSGILAAGSFSGATVAQNGTSVAAPQIARALANRLVDPAMNVEAARKDLLRDTKPVDKPSARPRPGPSGPPKTEPPSRVGAGMKKLVPNQGPRR